MLQHGRSAGGNAAAIDLMGESQRSAKREKQHKAEKEEHNQPRHSNTTGWHDDVDAEQSEAQA